MSRKSTPEQAYCSRVYEWQLDKIPGDNPNHEELVYAFQQYYKAYLHWIQSGTKRAGLDARYWLNELKLRAIDERKFVLAWLKEIKNRDIGEQSYKPMPKSKNKKRIKKIQGSIDNIDDNNE
jgi:hypothetical protein